MKLPNQGNYYLKISQFNYYSAIWMFHIRALNKKINRLQERC